MKTALVLSVALALGAASSACNDAAREATPIPGTRLGMSPRDVRDRFVGARAGTWQTQLGEGDDTVLEWRSRDASTPFSSARFEFHLGMLVAVRAHAREATTQEAISSTPKTVTVRRPSPEGGTEIDLLARDCPTHHDEAEAFAAKAR